MARITTKAGLRDYIRSQLGAPSIQIEVTDAQMDQIIDDTVQKFTEHAFGTLEETVLIQLSGIGDYPLPDTITNIIKLSSGSSSDISNFSANFGGYVPDIWSEQYFSGSLTGDIVKTIIGISNTRAIMEKFFGNDMAFNFNHHRKVLQLHEDYSGAALLHYEYEYIADDNNDLIFNHEWVKAYSIARVKILWGTVTGKYDQALVGGARINYGDMKSEADQELQILDEQLLTRWQDPAPVLIG